MTKYLPLLALVAGVSLTIGACVVGNRQASVNPIPVTCRELRNAPAEYAGYRVIVPTKGTEIIDGELIWRLHNPGEPDVIFSFAEDSIPDPLPAYVEGYCHAPVRGGPVRLVDCR